MTNLCSDLVVESILNSTVNSQRYRDAQTFKSITKFIAKGQAGTLSQVYSEALAPITNTGEYDSSDVVGISIQFASNYRKHSMDLEEILLAMRARAVLVTEMAYVREHNDNPAQREVVNFITRMGYRETNRSGYWLPINL